MQKDVVKIFIGYDPNETVAWHTLAHSILRSSSKPVAIVPINLANLKSIYNRPRDTKQSNDFSFSRFLVPFLCDYTGYAIFLDCDMLVRTDIVQIFDSIKQSPGRAVYVVKHDYEPKNEIKYLGNIQYKYPRKNWSSLVVWNCGHPANKKLTPALVNSADPMYLHRFQWLNDENIGDLDLSWNWLVGEYENPSHEIKILHWTIGGPYFEEFKDTDFADEWKNEYIMMNYCKQNKS